MRKIQKPIVVLLFALLAMISCRRETLPDKSNSQKEQDKTSTPSNVVYKKSPAEIATAKERWLKNALAGTTNIATRGGCDLHVSNNIEITGYTGVICSSTTLWDIEYTIWSLDWVGSGYVTAPVSATFTDVNSNTLSANLISSSANLVDPGCTNWWVDGYCLLLREYVYELSSVPAPSSAWPADLGDYSLGLLSGFLPGCAPLRGVAGDLRGGYSATEYAAMPALLTVNPSGGNLLIATECAILCPPPYVICPTGGVFSYRPQGSSGAYTNLTLTAIGGLFFGIPAGIYEYTCTLNYTIGGSSVTSLPKTGTFTL